MRDIDFELRGEFIPLDALLKATGLAESGGRAKALVAEGRASVDGRTELRKTCKLRAGQQVVLAGQRIRLIAPSGPADARHGAAPHSQPREELAGLSQSKALDHPGGP